MNKLLLTVATITLIAFTSCNKNENLVPDQNIEDVDLAMTTESVVTTDANLDDIMEATEYEVELYSGTAETVSALAVQQETATLKSTAFENPFKYRYRWGICPDIHIVSEEGGYPKTITLNYGEATQLENGRVIAGIIQIVISGPRRENGATRTITFDDFSVDTIAIAGESVKTFLKDEYKVLITRNITYTLPDGTYIETTAERTKTWVEGMSTPFQNDDDRFEITGYSVCIDSDGDEFRKEISIPLIKKGGCRYIVAGEVTLSKNAQIFAVIDYGDGSCDRTATFTTNEGTKEFTIGKRIRERRQNNNSGN